MATGNTTTAVLADSLPTIISSGRTTREQVGIMTQLCDRQTLGEGIGLSWTEVTLATLTATAVNETTESNNPQQYGDTSISITPSIIQIEVLLTDRVKQRISKVIASKMGTQLQQACARKQDLDGLATFSGATTTLCGAGVTMASGYVAAGNSRILSNATERGVPPVRCVLHGYQIKDLSDELTAAVGVAAIGEGITADVFKNGFKLPISGVEVYEDGNIAIDSSDDAIGGVFAKDALVYVQGRAPRAETKREPGIGGGADRLFYYEEYAFGERSAGNWLLGMKSDATAPSS